MTTYSSGQITSSQLIVNAFLNISQDVSQGSIIQQKINVDCSKKDLCNNCISLVKKYNLSNGDNSDLCRSCFCNLQNINLSNIIVLNTQAFQNSSGTEFGKQVLNSLVQASTQTGTNISSIDKNTKSLQTSAENVYDKLKQSGFQEAISGLESFQIVSLTNPNTSLINVELNTVINYLTKIIQQSTIISDDLSKMDSSINQILTTNTQSILYVIMGYITTLIIVAASIFVFSFMLNFVMEDLILYVS